jgi:protein-S-isoprenylcysteine O-methyltransferase Ste14
MSRAQLFGRASFAAVFVAWYVCARAPLSVSIAAGIAVIGVLLVLPIAWLGRRALDARTGAERAARVTVLVHAATMTVLGAAVIQAFRLARQRPGWLLPVPSGVGSALTAVTGVATALTVLNLALRGLGAPFGIVLSRRLATDWMYRWTRNPMLLATLSWFTALGLWLRSGWFVAWVVGSVAPVWLAFVKVYEERELELRFGAPYLEYRSRTPLFWPRRPARAEHAADPPTPPTAAECALPPNRSTIGRSRERPLRDREGARPKAQR